jgi:GTPase
VALVGYTNAGKSTLFNRLTDSKVLAKDMLFATLDPTMRVISLPHGRKVILSDTVGFISDLPTTLIAAFRATLEEVMEADVILHVRDVSHVETEAQALDVAAVLAELGVTEAQKANTIEVWNKADLLEPLEHAQREASATRREDAVLVSAIDGEGTERLFERVEKLLGADSNQFTVSLDATDGKGLAWLHQKGEVLERAALAKGKMRLTVRLDEDRAGQAKAIFGRAMKKA